MRCGRCALLFFAVLGLLVVTAAAEAGTETMTFSSAPIGQLSFGSSFTEDGMTVTDEAANCIVGDPLGWDATAPALYLDGANGTQNVGNSWVDFRLQGGGTFDLNQLEFFTNGDVAGHTRWIETSAGGLQEYLPGVHDQTITFSGSGFQGITWFQIHTVGSATEMDNVMFTTGAPVPEASTLLSFAALLLGAGAFAVCRPQNGQTLGRLVRGRMPVIAFAGALVLLQAPQHARAQDPFVAEYFGDKIEQFSPTGTDLGTFASAPGVNNPTALAFSGTGDLFVGNFNAGTIHEYSPTGADLGTFATGLSGPRGLAFNGNGDLFVSNEFNNTIHEYSATGADLGTFASTGLSAPTHLAFNTAGDLFVANFGDGTVHEFSPTGADLGTFASGLGHPVGLAFNKNGDLLVGDGANINELSPTGTDLGVFASTGDAPYTIAIDSAGNVFANAGPGANIEKFSPTGTDLGLFASIGDSVEDIAFRSSAAPVPEASTLLSFVGLLLGAGALAVRRRAR